jgi:ANTAR domain
MTALETPRVAYSSPWGARDVELAQRVHSAALQADLEPAATSVRTASAIFTRSMPAWASNCRCGAIDITLQRFKEYHGLQEAFGRRAVIEQAKGILMARYLIDSDTAFEMLRHHSQQYGRNFAEVAVADPDASHPMSTRCRSERDRALSANIDVTSPAPSTTVQP